MTTRSKYALSGVSRIKSQQDQGKVRRFQERSYRNWIKRSNLKLFRVVIQETDLQIGADTDLTQVVRESVLTHRGHLESYIQSYPGFKDALTPWPLAFPTAKVVSDMIAAGQKAKVGPMAAVAGAIAERVGRDILRHSSQVIIENGGDVYIHSNQNLTVGLYANGSPLSGRIGIRIVKDFFPAAICTSSASVGHSLSLGRADAACILSKSGALADAAATAVGNVIHTADDIPMAIDVARSITGVAGAVLIVGKKIGLWGEIELVPLGGKKG